MERVYGAMRVSFLPWKRLGTDWDPAGRPLLTSYKSALEIANWLAEHPNDEDRVTEKGTVACVEEWWLAGASACPQAKALEQRKRFFANCQCSGLEDLLERAKHIDFW